VRTPSINPNKEHSMETVNKTLTVREWEIINEALHLLINASDGTNYDSPTSDLACNVGEIDNIIGKIIQR
jgi:hypothetical protein